MKHHYLARALLICAVILLAASCVWSAHAQSTPALSTNFSGTIGNTNTFQLIQGQNNGRKGCLIQDTGTHTMYVYFGLISSATLATSVQLSAGQAVSCATNSGYVVQDAISITGTSGDTFFANFQ